MPLMRTPQDTGPRLEGGTYEMVVTRIREDHIDNSQFGTGDVIKFTLATTDVVDPNGDPVELEAMANDSLTPLSKLTRWMNALGVGVTPGVPLDLEKALNRKCLVNVEIEDKGDKGQFNKIVDLLPPLRARGTRPAPQDVPADAPQRTESEVAPAEVYHPAVKPGEPVTDATLVSDTQIGALRNLLGDVYGASDKHIEAGYQELAEELKLPALMAQMRVPEMKHAIDALKVKKAALA